MKETSNSLTPEQKGAVVGLGRMFLMVHRSGFIWNSETNESLAPMDYVNGVLEKCGIATRFTPPPEERDPKALCVVSGAGEVLAGKVTRALERMTRARPAEMVQAVLMAGWWKPARGHGGKVVEVRVVPARDLDSTAPGPGNSGRS